MNLEKETNGMIKKPQKESTAVKRGKEDKYKKEERIMKRKKLLHIRGEFFIRSLHVFMLDLLPVHEETKFQIQSAFAQH